jgi:hypothetical protein
VEKQSADDTTRKKTQEWMAYIEAEVAAACRKNSWGHQIRRKWSVREKPVSSSTIDDYEWKLLPRDQSVPREAAPREFDEGTYFVLGFESSKGKFVLQHDTNHGGVMGDHWFTNTYTEIRLPSNLWPGPEFADAIDLNNPLPASGWLQRFLLALTARFRPNSFCVT